MTSTKLQDCCVRKQQQRKDLREMPRPAESALGWWAAGGRTAPPGDIGVSGSLVQLEPGSSFAGRNILACADGEPVKQPAADWSDVALEGPAGGGKDILPLSHLCDYV